MIHKRVTTLNVRNVPVDTKAIFKGWCAAKGYTMEKAVVALLKKAVTEDFPLRSARGTSHKRSREENE